MSPPALVAVGCTDFSVDLPTDEIRSGWEGTVSVPHHAASGESAGGVWEGSGRRAGHQVCWRISGAELELTESCLLPGVKLADSSLRLRFACGLLPSIGLAQLRDDSLLLSAALHAPTGGAFIYQLRFELPPDESLIQSAVVERRSWFAGQYPALSTPEPVAQLLGPVLAAAFSAQAEQVGPQQWRTHAVLGGEGSQCVHVALTVDFGPDAASAVHASQAPLSAERSVLSALLGQTVATRVGPVAGAVAGAIGLPGSGRTSSPLEAICGSGGRR